MIKKIFIYWHKSYILAPKIVKKCINSWKIMNPLWEIIILDDTNLDNYISIKSEIVNIDNKNISKAAFSDILRIFLLEKYGGCWCDATTYCNNSLDNWLYKYIETGFFAFDKPGKDRLISSWFLYADDNCYIIKKWKEETIKYWNINNTNKEYFWFHYLFGDLYKSDNLYKNLHDKSIKISAIEPHFLQSYGILNSINDKIKNHIQNKITPVYKLTHHFNENNIKNDSIIDYMLNYKTQVNISFVHIGKCGGTYVNTLLKIKEYHLNNKYEQNEYFIIWIRNPLKRFVSAFNYSFNIINTDTSKLDINNLTLDNCLAPYRIKFKMTHTYTFSKRYDYLIIFFKNPNDLAESLTSENIDIKNMAYELMNSKLEHIYNGIGWYLHNGKFIEENYKKILFIGCQENMKNDIEKLSKIIELKNNISEKIRENTSTNLYLSDKAIKNLLDFYKETDYKALETLYSYNFIEKSILDEYYTYKFV
jgi:hypothetical protein